MALNKSTKHTPSRSGYFPELTASAGKQTNYLMPVRIKITPKNSIAPLSDGKKNAAPKFKPVLVKDLLRSTEKGKQNITLTSVSTQKKKKNPAKVADPYLNTQSCYKPKNNEEESVFFNRKSLGSCKVRRQLYQNLDSSQKVSFESSEIPSNVNKTKKVVAKNSLINTQSKIRKSFLLPPNSIKNSIIRKTEASNKAPGKQNKNSSKNTTTGKSIKNILPVAESVKPNKNDEKSIYVYEDEADMDIDLSSPQIDVNEKKQSPVMRDNFTMTSPCLNRESSKSITNINTLERPSAIMSPSKSKSSNLMNSEPPCTEMQNLNINTVPCSCSDKMKNTTTKNTIQDIDFSNMINMNQNNLTQMKSYIEQSIQASEDNVIKLKQLLLFINNLSSASEKDDSKINDSKSDGEDEALKIAVGNEDNPCETSVETITLNLSSPVLESDNNVCERSSESEQSTEFYRKLPIPMKILISADDMNEEAKELSLNQLTEMARLSTIGEVSCEGDLSSKIDCENKENHSDYLNVTVPTTPKSPKTPRRRTIGTGSCDSQGRRRSARLAAKRMSLTSLSDSDSRQDSFTMLENELNVVHGKLPSKSLPASPAKAPLTPGFAKQWDKRIERPLKEYMALKMNGTFLVTPDVKRFQSRLESTDTPHSRKSLSRKIFMELCDLYAESPDSSK